MINNSLSVLVTGAGSIYGIGIIRALKASSLPIQIIATDINPYSLGLYKSDEGFIAPLVSDEKDYYKFVKDLCREFDIKAIFIGASSELNFYAKKRTLLEQHTGAKVFVNNSKVLKICNDKWLTMKYLYRQTFAVPDSIRYPEDSKKLIDFINKHKYPLIIKPRVGNGSNGVIMVCSKEELIKYLEGKNELLIQEYIDGDEFTVGICLDSRHQVISKIALKRHLQDGISIAAISENYQDIASYCADVAKSLDAYGAINVQLRLKDGKPVIFEINPRFSSSTGMRLLFGINEPECLIRTEILNEQVHTIEPKPGIALRQYKDYYYPLDLYKKLD